MLVRVNWDPFNINGAFTLWEWEWGVMGMDWEWEWAKMRMRNGNKISMFTWQK